MRCFRFIPLFLLLVPALFSCNKTLNVDASWKDITVVYGLLDQSADTTYLKITKAFLGPGDALQFAKTPDSSNYPDTLEVRLNEYSSPTDTNLVKSNLCGITTIHNKQKGDSIFYYPDQRVYFTTAKLNENHTYKLFIKSKKTGQVTTGQTDLIYKFDINKPQNSASFIPGQPFEVNWNPAKNGIRYQLTVRFYYLEWLKTDPLNQKMKSLDWVVFKDIRTVDVQSTLPFDQFFSGDAFFAFVGSQIDTSSFIGRYAHHCDFIFSVASADLNTYMEVTEPSLSIVQEKPPFTNIVNGIGLFTARLTNRTDSLGISPNTKGALKTNINTKNRGF